MNKWVTIQVNDELRQVCITDFAVTPRVGSGKPEVVYMKIGDWYNTLYIPIFDAKLPRTNVFVKLEGVNMPVNLNVISEGTLNRIVELEKEKEEKVRKIEEEVRRLNSYDVFVQEKGKLARIIVDKDVRYVREGKLYVGCYGVYYTPETANGKNLAVKVHVTKKLKYEEGTEEVIEEYEADGCESETVYESDDGYGIRRWTDVYEKPETRKVIAKLEKEYTMIPVKEMVSKLLKEKEELEKRVYEEEKRVLIEELQRRGFRLSRNGNKFTIEFNGETSEAILEPEEGLLFKGKYSLLAVLLL